MSTGEQSSAAAAASAGEAEVKEASLLDQVIGATKQTERSRAEELMKTLVDQALVGTVRWDKNVTKTINAAIKAIDETISKQLAAIMHHPDFQKLEGTWRGLNYLVMNSETGATLKIKVLNVPKKELFKDVDTAVEFDQSQIFKKLYENEFGMPGGEPYGALIGDYEFTNHPEDIDLLGKMSNVAAAAFCPFVSAAAPQALRIRELGGAGQAARPGKDLPRHRIHQVAVVPRLGRFAVRQSRDASDTLAAALRRGHQADRGVRLRGSRREQAGAARRVHLDERGLRHGDEDDRVLRHVRLLRRHPRGGGGRQGRGPACLHLQKRRR